MVVTVSHVLDCKASKPEGQFTNIFLFDNLDENFSCFLKMIYFLFFPICLKVGTLLDTFRLRIDVIPHSKWKVSFQIDTGDRFGEDWRLCFRKCLAGNKFRKFTVLKSALPYLCWSCYLNFMNQPWQCLMLSSSNPCGHAYLNLCK